MSKHLLSTCTYLFWNYETWIEETVGDMKTHRRVQLVKVTSGVQNCKMGGLFVKSGRFHVGCPMHSAKPCACGQGDTVMRQIGCEFWEPVSKLNRREYNLCHRAVTAAGGRKGFRENCRHWQLFWESLSKLKSIFSSWFNKSNMHYWIWFLVDSLAHWA